VAKTDKSDRRAVLESMRTQQKNADRRRNLMIVGACCLVALLIVGAAAYAPLKNRLDLAAFNSTKLADIGAKASVCGKIATKPATGSQDHATEPEPLTFADSPPAFGRHYDVWEGMERKLYTKEDRPPIGRLVHNQEHGYTILWYDETAAKDDEQMRLLRGVAAKFKGTDNLRLKFKAAPWLKSDGAAFPKGQHIAFTHWSAGGVGEAANGEQVGATQYCSEISGEALEKFMLKYPYTDSPEPSVV
jgi:Protein of unknown function (DUF3105)